MGNQIRQSQSEGISIYKHWDGYPETTVPELQDFLKWNDNRNNDMEYTVANYVYWYKNKHQKEQIKNGHSVNGGWTNDCGHTGLGITVKKFFLGATKQICKEAYQEYGAEYVYVVDLDNKVIRELTLGLEWGFVKGTFVSVEQSQLIAKQGDNFPL